MVCFAAAPSYNYRDDFILDREILTDLYMTWGGTNPQSGWLNRTNWLSSASMCSWAGVSCICPDPTASDPSCHVSSLILPANNIRGSIPGFLGNLANLTVLDLSNNTLTGTLPPELGQLMQLSSLSLFNTSLTGSIPSFLSQCPGLSHLDLSANMLTGPLPTQLFQLSSLQSLLLSQNQLTGQV